MDSKELKTGTRRAICTSVFIAALFTTAKKWKQPKMSIDGWMDKQNVVYTYNGICLSLERKEIPRHVTTRMNLEDIVQSLSLVQLFCDPVDYSPPARLFCPWDFPGKNTGMGCHSSLQVEDIMLSEINQIQKDKYCMILLTWGSQRRQTQRDKEWNGGVQGLEERGWGVSI